MLRRRADQEFTELIRTHLGDRYQIINELGRGGMATVFLANQQSPRRRVALKVLHPEVAGHVARQRFLREIELAGGLSHPHILPLYDAGAEGEILFYSMPYVSGSNLRQRLQQGPFSPAEAVHLGCEVADALACAHRNGVVHRDIKPENILLADGHALVSDFGVARALGPDATSALTASGIAIGTPAYMSPEQVRGELVDERSDIYSLGCVIYEMLTGSPPFLGHNPGDVMSLHIHRRAPRIGWRSAPRRLARTVRRCLRKDADRRYASATELSEALRAHDRAPGFSRLLELFLPSG